MDVSQTRAQHWKPPCQLTLDITWPPVLLQQQMAKVAGDWGIEWQQCGRGREESRHTPSVTELAQVGVNPSGTIEKKTRTWHLQLPCPNDFPTPKYRIQIPLGSQSRHAHPSTKALGREDRAQMIRHMAWGYTSLVSLLYLFSLCSIFLGRCQYGTARAVVLRI